MRSSRYEVLKRMKLRFELRLRSSASLYASMFSVIWLPPHAGQCQRFDTE